jgi:hypothetical protein
VDHRHLAIDRGEHLEGDAYFPGARDVFAYDQKI